MKIRHSIKYYLIYFCAFFIMSVAYWMKKHFGQVSLNEIVTNVVLANNIGALPNLHIYQYFIYNPLALTLIIILLERMVSYCLQHGVRKMVAQMIDHHVWSHVKHTISRIYQFNVPLALLGISCLYFLTSISNISSFSSGMISHSLDFYKQNYHIGSVTHPTPAKKNLIYIYVEDLENTYSDLNFFCKDHLFQMHALEDSKYGYTYHFDRFKQYEGANFTIAGLAATQCGLPITPQVMQASKTFERFKKRQFLQVKCLGDYLTEQGYYNVFMGGASLEYAKKGNFFRSHQYHEVYGREEWQRLKISSSDFHKLGGWGLYDDSLFRQAKDKVLELHKTKQPFNLTMLTVDTHMPIGYLSNTCNNANFKATVFTDIIECTAYLVYDYIEFLQANGILKNTLVVISGDHIGMDGLSISNKLKLNPNRTVFNLFISPTPLEINRKEFSHFSMLPSVLEALDFKVEGKRLGLGLSGFGEIDDMLKKTHLDYMSPQTINPKIIAPSDEYNRFW